MSQPLSPLPKDAVPVPAEDVAAILHKRAPTLYGIIALKLGKGAIFISLACFAYALSDNNLPMEFQSFVHKLGLNPERKIMTDLAAKISHITETNVLWVAGLMFAYGLFSFVEGVGLLLRFSWGAWMAIGESAFFVPLEIYELIHRFRWKVFIILVINLIIFWYLVANRKRLFRHHYHHHH